jgi:hypothetical protein
MRPYLEKNPSQKKDWWSDSSGRELVPEFKPAKKKKRARFCSTLNTIQTWGQFYD